MRTDLEALVRKFRRNYAVDERRINGHQAVAFTFVTNRGAYLRNESLFLEYFGAPIKREGAQVHVPETIPVHLIPFINAPLGRLIGTVAAIKQSIPPKEIYEALVATFGGCRKPLVDLTNPQTLYAKEKKGYSATVELAKVCPHQSTPMRTTIVLAGFYALPN